MGEEMSGRRIAELQRRAYLNALGVECWVRREKPAGGVSESIAALEQGQAHALSMVPADAASAMPVESNPQSLITAVQGQGQADGASLARTPSAIQAREPNETQPATRGAEARPLTRESNLPRPASTGESQTSPAARGADQTSPAARGADQSYPAARGADQSNPAAPPQTRQTSTRSRATAETAARPCLSARETIPSGATAPAMDADAAQAWEILRAEVAPCVRCELHKQRTQTVFGAGNPQADWLVIGEAPGADEDRLGEPFVGKAGQLLTAMLFAIGFKRDDVYITNVVKCRPPQNRDPQPQETAACADYLRRQIDLIQPKIILALGRIAAQNLLNTDTPIGKLRQVTHRYAGTSIPLVATYHPAYLLRSPLEKRKAWQDLLFAREVLARSSGID